MGDPDIDRRDHTGVAGRGHRAASRGRRDRADRRGHRGEQRASTASASPGPGCPETVVVKLPGPRRGGRVHLDGAAHVHRGRPASSPSSPHQAPDARPRVPPPAVDHETSEFVLVMEDIGGCGPSTRSRAWPSPTPSGPSTAWPRGTPPGGARPTRSPTAGLTVSLGDEIYKAVLPMVFAEGWEKLSAELDVPAAIRAVGAPVDRRHPGPPRRAGRGADDDDPRRLPRRQPVLRRRRLRGGRRLPAHRHRRGAYDLAYFVTQSLDARRRLGPRAGPVRPLDRRPAWPPACPRPISPTAWEDYRKAALFCLVYPVVAWRGMDVDDPRQVGLATTMLDRFDRAVDRARPRRAALDAWRIRGRWRTLASRNPRSTDLLGQ